MPNIEQPNWTDRNRPPGFAVSSHGAPDIVVYPDSNKISASERNPDGTGINTLFDRADEVDYWQGEMPPAAE